MTSDGSKPCLAARCMMVALAGAIVEDKPTFSASDVCSTASLINPNNKGISYGSHAKAAWDSVNPMPLLRADMLQGLHHFGQ